ncbi:3-dehydroquinate synthase [Fodinisporobacter ferrooxydans]|uniref:3-dehydroquinate synthase n=1 Tax=Fodinisporobacter ferrooxydans TaxID=2901836 RepID=A0ABY4CGS9_9BACL|nr:3-dehydroquinate synthase [Alicyclobacillaceae bacterium MYW30-H2]
MNGIHELRVQASSGSYVIRIGNGLPETIDKTLEEFGWSKKTPTMVITDDTVAALPWFQQLRSTLEMSCTRMIAAAIPAGEQSKSLEEAARFYDLAYTAGFDRDTWILAIGGGVVGDLAGFVAATYMRGVSFVQIPTTLLAHDSSIGGKVAVNHPKGKNIIGAFHQPRAVLYDVSTLQTLPEREFRSGLAEAVKHALIADVSLWQWLAEHHAGIRERNLDVLAELLYRSCKVKAGIVERDEKETNERALLNFGHTFGHAFETLLGYGTLTHGEAVSIGMVAALALGALLNEHSQSLKEEVENVLTSLSLPVRLPIPIDANEAIELMRKDKKARAEQLTFILLQEIGKAAIRIGVPIDSAKVALQAVAKER